MAKLPIAMRVNGERDARTLSRDLRRAANGELQRLLTRNVQAAARPVLLRVRAAALGIYGGTYSAGTRANTARVTRTRPRVGGVRFYVASSEMPAGREVMPGLYEGPGGWYHPTFGHPPYVAQNAHPWFEKTIAANEPTLRAGVEKAMDEIADMIGA